MQKSVAARSNTAGCLHNMGIVVAFTGCSNSGKTTLIERLIKQLAPSFRVAAIKHDPKDKARFDTEGKDSYKFSSAGADVAVLSPEKSSFFLQRELELEEAIERLKPFDYLFVEGLKHLLLPRIGVFRERIEEEYLPHISAAALGSGVDGSRIGRDIAKLELENIDAIIAWIEQEGRRV